MAWIKPEKTHTCRKPILWPWIPDNAVWECLWCNTQWRFYRHALTITWKAL